MIHLDTAIHPYGFDASGTLETLCRSCRLQLPKVAAAQVLFAQSMVSR